MTKRQHIGWGVLASLALAGPAWGADFNLNVTAAGVRLGQPVLGPKFTADDLKGKVLLLEFWGIN
jgi:hypothetical protein